MALVGLKGGGYVTAKRLEELGKTPEDVKGMTMEEVMKEGGGGGSNPFGTDKKENILIAQEMLKNEGFDSTTKSSSGRKINPLEPGIYNNQTKEIFLNPRSKYWTDPAKFTKYNYDKGQISSSDPKHLINHEIAHGKFNVNKQIFVPYEKNIALKVSKYAGTNTAEFVSEVYAGIKAGKSFSKDVMRLYRRYAKPRD